VLHLVLSRRTGGDKAVEDKIIAQCSNCQAQFKLDRDKIGKKIRCPKCANVFVVEESKPKTEAKIITQCSNCQAQFKLDRDKIGKKIRCPKCANVFVVEEVKAEPKPAATPTAPKAAPIPQIPTPKAAPTPPTKKAPAAPLAKEESVPAAKTVIPLDQRTRPLKVRDFMETQYTRFIPEKAQGVDAHISYDFGDEGGQWTVIIKNGECEIKEGADPTAKSHVKMKAETYLKIATDQLDSRVAFMLGKLKIKGDKQSVATFRECFQKTGLKTWK
jgi:predicted Zn finger-like uncharacterized protein